MNDRSRQTNHVQETGETRRALHSKAAKLGVLVLLIVFTTGSILAACGGDDDGEATNGAEGATIGISWPFPGVAYWGAYNDLWQEEAENAGVTVLPSQADTDITAQVEEIDRWVDRGVDAILIGPVDDDSVAPAVQRANDAGIEVITYRSPLEGISGGMYYDDVPGGYDLGQVAAEWINENLDGSAEVGLLTFLEQQTTRDRIDHARRAIEELADGDVEFHTERALLSDEGLEATENLLSANPGIRVILCTADDGCLGARAAYINSGLPRDNVFIAGWDGSKPVLDFIADGDDLIRATAALPLEDLGRDMVRIPVRVLEGEEQPVEVTHPYTNITEDSPPDELDRFLAIYDE